MWVDYIENDLYVLQHSHQFGQVHVPQDPHDNGGLCVIRIGPFCSAKCAQDWQDITETKVVVNLTENRKPPQKLQKPFY